MNNDTNNSHTPPEYKGETFLNPDYGKGVFRRRILLSSSPASVVAELEDCMHGFRSTILHDNTQVTEVLGETLRYPMSTCPGATAPLQELLGLPLSMTAEEINKAGNPFGNCTHLYDLSILAIAHTQWDKKTRQYDVEVDDEVAGKSEARVYLDGELVHCWLTKEFCVQAPAQLAGNTLFKGFSHWAKPSFSGVELEAAHVLQKGYFVAQARRFDTEKAAGQTALHEQTRRNVCYSYSDGVIEGAIRLGGTSRDFTDTPEQLLSFQ